MPFSLLLKGPRSLLDWVATEYPKQKFIKTRKNETSTLTVTIDGEEKRQVSGEAKIRSYLKGFMIYEK